MRKASSLELEAAEVGFGLGDPSDVDPLAYMAFNLTSRPGATRKIYLDFLGGTVTGTAWNAKFPTANITIPPYDKDGNEGRFSE